MFWPILLLTVAGFTLLAIEVYVPGMVAGTFGGLCLAAAVVLGFAGYGLEVGLMMLGGIGVVTIAGFIGWMQIMPRTTVGRKMTLTKSVSGSTHEADLAELVGKEGVAVTHLRPAGTAEVAGRRVDVVAEEGYLAAGTRVVVRGVEGFRVLVRAA